MTSNYKKRLAGEELKTALEAACRGLHFISETDSPIDVIFVPSNDPPPADRAFLVIAESGSDEAAREFFDRLTAYKEWHAEEDRRSVRRYRALRKLILENLEDVRLIRRGRVRIEIFLIGKDAEGNIAGIRTKAVET